MFSCILLSAGLSSRFGSPKALVKLNNSTLIESLQQTLVNSLVDEIIIVLGSNADDIKPYILKHKKVQFVYNKDYKFGQTCSFKTGLEHITEQTDAILLLPVDYPLISSTTINYLIQSFKKQAPQILIPTYNGIKGHPPLFSFQLKEQFLQLKNEDGINSIAHQFSEETVYLPVEDSGIIKTFNTQDDLDSIEKQSQ